jgi:hypothetical protein
MGQADRYDELLDVDGQTMPELLLITPEQAEEMGCPVDARPATLPDGTQPMPPSPSYALQVWGQREDIREIAYRIRRVMPGGDKLHWSEIILLAQYSVMMDANVLRGEIYAFVDKRGRLCFVEGYKLLVRWANRKGGFIDDYQPLGDLAEGDIGFTCSLLRRSDLAVLQGLTKAGATFDRAWEICSISAVGIVRAKEMQTKDGTLIDPPKGWDWEQVAKKRALKTGINFAFGAPSPAELARETWMVGNTRTTAQDWEEALDTPGLTAPGRERVAALSAQTRATLEKQASLSDEELAEQLHQNRIVFHGTQDDQDGTLI